MKTNLFNEKTIQKNIAKIEPTVKQKSASKKWIELLEKNELQEEVANYPRFIALILNELLGFDTIKLSILTNFYTSLIHSLSKSYSSRYALPHTLGNE